MKPFPLKIVVPSGTVFDDEIASFSARGVEGDFAVLADHVPFATYVTEGECHVMNRDGTVRRAQTAGGLITVDRAGVLFLPSSLTWAETD